MTRSPLFRVPSRPGLRRWVLLPLAAVAASALLSCGRTVRPPARAAAAPAASQAAPATGPAEPAANMAASTTGPAEPESQLSAAASPAAPMSASPAAPMSASAAAPMSDSAAAPPAPDDSWKLAWANGYLKWPLVTGYVFSRSHGSRLALIRVTPLAAAKIRARNAESIRHLKPEDVKVYPVGAMIAMETWDVAANETRGPAGPIFFMKKEAPGYDSEAGDWRYGMTRADGSLLADGKDGRATECRACHIRMKKLDFVPAKDR